MIGITMGLYLLEPYGKIRNIKTLKLLKDSRDIKFFEILSSIDFLNMSSLDPFSIGFCCFDPFSIGFCCCVLIDSIYNAYNYSLSYKKQVDEGVYDEDD
jgi:hypothetical protein